jgi:hypothetical protein
LSYTRLQRRTGRAVFDPETAPVQEP